MLTLNRKTEYAVIAMADLAHRGTDRVSAREIAESTRLPLPMLTNVLHQLLRNGLVTSAMGSRGGYRLARTPEEVTFGDMINAIEGPFKLTACCMTGDGSAEGSEECTRTGSCPLSESMKRVHDGFKHLLDGVTLAQLAAGTLPAGLGLGSNGKKRNGGSRPARA